MVHFTGSTDPGDPTGKSYPDKETHCMICGGYGTLANLGNYDKVCNDCAPGYVKNEIEEHGESYCNGFKIIPNMTFGFVHGFHFKSVAHPLTESFVDSFEEGMKKILK